MKCIYHQMIVIDWLYLFLLRVFRYTFMTIVLFSLRRDSVDRYIHVLVLIMRSTSSILVFCSRRKSFSKYVRLVLMEYKHQTTFICLLFLIVNSKYKFSRWDLQAIFILVNGVSTIPEPEIITTQDEVITYVNHTAKLSCLIQNRNRQHVGKMICFF
jgi:hypothetical protein